MREVEHVLWIITFTVYLSFINLATKRFVWQPLLEATNNVVISKVIVVTSTVFFLLLFAWVYIYFTQPRDKDDDS